MKTQALAIKSKVTSHAAIGWTAAFCVVIAMTTLAALLLGMHSAG